MFSFIWEEGQPSLAGSRYWLPRSRLGGLEIFHINALKRAGPLRRASKSYTRQRLLWPAFLGITFHFTSSVCLCVSYKMKTCTPISDSGFRHFRGKINVVGPGDSAKRASPGRRAGFSNVNARWNPALLLGLALPRELALLHVNTPRWPAVIQLNTCFHLSNWRDVFLSFIIFIFFSGWPISWVSRVWFSFKVKISFLVREGLVFVISWWNLLIKWRHVSLAVGNKWPVIHREVISTWTKLGPIMWDF